MSENTKKRMLKAREAIKANQYDKARKLLKGINHPTAKKWLTTLDKIDPKPTAKIGLVQFVILCVIFVCSAFTCIVMVAPEPTETPTTQTTAPSVRLTNDSGEPSVQLSTVHTLTPSGLQDALSLSLVEVVGIEQVVTSNTMRVENRGDVYVTLAIHVASGFDLNDMLDGITQKTALYANTVTSEEVPLSIDLTIYSGADYDRWVYGANGWRVLERNGIRITVTPYPTSPPQSQVVQPVQPQAPVRNNTSNQSVSPLRSCNCGAGDTLNCDDFSSSSAQACFNKCMREVGRDVHGLDGNNNGVACES